MFDVEKFIAMVEERPALYDPRVQEYSSRDVKSRCWWEIGSQVYDNWDMLNVREKYDKEKELMRKWKAIRDNFVKDIRYRKKLTNGVGVPKRRRYIHYTAMQFLLPIIDDSEDPEQSATDKKANLQEFRTKTTTKPIRVKISAPIPATAFKSENTTRQEETRVKDEREESIETSTEEIKNIDTNFLSVSNISSTTTASKNILPNDRNRDIFGNRAFLLSYLPIMDDLPSDLALEARLKITEVFKSVCAASVTRRSMHSDQDLILPEALVELVDSPNDNVSLDIDLSN